MPELKTATEGVIKSSRIPEKCGFRLPFAKPMLQHWGPGGENFILQQSYVSEHFGVALLDFSFRQRTALRVECLHPMNMGQYSLGGDAIAYITGHGYMPIFGQTATIQYLPQGNHAAWFEPGQYRYLYFIITSPQLRLLVSEHPTLKILIDRLSESHPAGTMAVRMIVDKITLGLINSLKSYNQSGTSLNLLLNNFLTDLLSAYHQQAKITSFSALSKKELIYHIKSYIGDHLIGDPSLTTDAVLARHFSITERTMHRNWEKEFGDTPQRFILRMKMNAALYMLVSEKPPVKEVADRLHYSDASAFSREFTRHFGFPPSTALHHF